MKYAGMRLIKRAIMPLSPRVNFIDDKKKIEIKKVMKAHPAGLAVLGGAVIPESSL